MYVAVSSTASLTVARACVYTAVVTYGPYTLSGEGQQIYGTTAAILVTDIVVQVTSIPLKARIWGDVAPRGLWHIGWFGVGWSVDGGGGIGADIVEDGFFIDSEYRDYYILNHRVDMYSDTLHYKLNTGVVAVFTVFNL